MNPSERHQQITMRVRSGTPIMCMAMAPPERKEFILTSSGANPSLAAPTQWVSALVTAMILEVLTERSP